jgi:hypothetical protein
MPHARADRRSLELCQRETTSSIAPQRPWVASYAANRALRLDPAGFSGFVQVENFVGAAGGYLRVAGCSMMEHGATGDSARIFY